MPTAAVMITALSYAINGLSIVVAFGMLILYVFISGNSNKKALPKSPVDLYFDVPVCIEEFEFCMYKKFE